MDSRNIPRFRPAPTSWLGRTVEALKVEARYFRVLLWTFRRPFIAFCLMIPLGAWLLQHTYNGSVPVEHTISFMRAVQATFYMVFFEYTLDYFPESFLAEALTFAIPIIGIAIIAEGLIRFGVLYFNREQNMNEWNHSVASTYNNHVVLGGAGKVGVRIATRLHHNGTQVVALERDEESPHIEELHKLHIPVLTGCVTDANLLEKAHIDKAATVIAATDNDLTNLEMALNARELNPDVKVILRMYKDSLAKKLSKAFNFGIIFSTSALSAPAFAAAVYSDKILHSMDIDGLHLHTASFTIPASSPLDGMQVKTLEGDYHLSLIAHTGPGREDFHPHPEATLEAGQSVVIMGTYEDIEVMEELVEGKRTSVQGGSGESP